MKIGGVIAWHKSRLANIFNVETFGAIGDGVTDDTAAIQAAIDAAASGGTYQNKYADAGGVVELQNKTYVISSINMKSNVILRGKGRRTTLLHKSGSNDTGMITMYHYGVNGGHDWYANQFCIRDLCIDGNKSAYSIVCTFDGTTNYVNKSNHGLSADTPIRFDNGLLPTGLTAGLTYYVKTVDANNFQVAAAPAGAAIDFTGNGSGTTSYVTSFTSGLYFTAPSGYYEWVIDNYSRMENLFIQNCTGHAVQVPSTASQNALAMFYKGIVVRNCVGDGFNINSSDNHFHDCYIAGCHYGMYINGGNNNIVQCKSYYSTDTGLYLDSGCTGVKVTAYEAQEEYSTGLYLKQCNNVLVTNLASEANGHNNGTSTSLGIGLVLDGCKNCRVIGNVANRNGLAGDIQYAVKWLNAPQGCDVNVNVSTTDTTRPVLNISDIRPPVTNKMTVNNTRYNYPNKAERNSKLLSTSGATIADFWTKTNPSNTTSVYSIDDEAQKINITGNTSGGAKAVYAYTLVPVTSGQKIRVGALCKVDDGTKIQCKVLVNYFDATYDINGTGSVAASGSEVIVTHTSKQYSWATFTDTVPASAVYARICLQAVSTANGNTGSAWFKEFIFEDEASLNPISAENMDIHTRTASFTLEAGDANKLHRLNHATVAIVATIPTNANVPYPIGTEMKFQQMGAAQVSVACADTIRSKANGLKISAQYGVITVRKVAATEWMVFGDTTP